MALPEVVSASERRQRERQFSIEQRKRRKAEKRAAEDEFDIRQQAAQAAARRHIVHKQAAKQSEDAERAYRERKLRQVP